MPLIDVRDVSHAYGQPPRERVVLSEVSVRLTDRT